VDFVRGRTHAQAWRSVSPARGIILAAALGTLLWIALVLLVEILR
jgi:hypothetical protein